MAIINFLPKEARPGNFNKYNPTELITTDGKLILDGILISQKRLTNSKRNNIILHNYFFYSLLTLRLTE